VLVVEFEPQRLVQLQLEPQQQRELVAVLQEQQQRELLQQVLQVQKPLRRQCRLIQDARQLEQLYQLQHQ
jgi:predicted Zn-ribbon and HTH transcriptional regulator